MGSAIDTLTEGAKNTPNVGGLLSAPSQTSAIDTLTATPKSAFEPYFFQGTEPQGAASVVSAVTPPVQAKQPAPEVKNDYKGYFFPGLSELKAPAPQSAFDEAYGKIRSFFFDPTRTQTTQDKAKAMNDYFTETHPLLFSRLSSHPELAPQLSEFQKISNKIDSMSFPEKVISVGVLGGLAASPVGTAIGLAEFTALDTILKKGASLIRQKNISSLSDVLPPDVPQYTRDLVDIFGFLAEGKAIHGINKIAPDIFESLTKNLITQYKLPQTVFIDGKTARDIVNGVDTLSEKANLLKGLGASADTLRDAARNGISIEVPSEKIVTLADRPYWAKLKTAIGLMPGEADIRITPEGKPSGTVNRLALPAGETKTSAIDTLIQPEVTKPSVVLPKEIQPLLEISKDLQLPAQKAVAEGKTLEERSFALLEGDFQGAGFVNRGGVWIDERLPQNVGSQIDAKLAAELKANGIEIIEVVPKTATGIEYGQKVIGGKTYGTIKIGENAKLDNTVISNVLRHEAGHGAYFKLTPEEQAFFRANYTPSGSEITHQAGGTGGKLLQEGESFADFILYALEGTPEKIPQKVRPLVEKYTNQTKSDLIKAFEEGKTVEGGTRSERGLPSLKTLLDEGDNLEKSIAGKRGTMQGIKVEFLPPENGRMARVKILEDSVEYGVKKGDIQQYSLPDAVSGKLKINLEENNVVSKLKQKAVSDTEYTPDDVIKIINKTTGESQERIVKRVLPDGSGLVVMRPDGVGIPNKASYDKWDISLVKKGSGVAPQMGTSFKELAAMEEAGVKTEAEAKAFLERYRSIQEAQATVPETQTLLYHGTSAEAVDKIRQEGFKTSPDTKGIYVTTDREMARFYTIKNGTNYDDKNILAVLPKEGAVPLETIVEGDTREYVYKPEDLQVLDEFTRMLMEDSITTGPEEPTVIGSQDKFKKYIAVYNDELDSLLQGKIHLRVTDTGVKTEYKEILGKAGYMRVFRKEPNLRSSDEFAAEIGMDENQLIEEMQRRIFDNTFNRPKLLEYKAAMDGRELGFNPKNLDDLDSPQAIKESDKIVKRSEIAKQLSEKLNVPIRRGKFRHAGAIGLFKPGPKVVRIKSGGLPVVFHEVGHFLDDKFKFSKDINIVERKALMLEYGYTYEGQAKKQQKEAFAEFLRFRMTGQEAKALKLAPQFSQVFDYRIEELPEIKDVIDTATADYKRWQEQPATAKVLSQISFEEEKGSLLSRATSQLHNFYTMALDDLHPLAEFSKLAGKIIAAKDPYILARNLRGWIGKADTFLNRGTFGKDYWKVENGKMVAQFKGKSFSEIVRPIEQAGNINDFRVYLVSRRITEDLAGRSIRTGINTADAKAALRELETRFPEFKQAAEDLYKYQDELLNYAADNGLVGEEGLKKIKALNKARVPFYRVMETIQGGYMGGKKIAGNMGSPIKKIKGSEREIIDPLESIIKDTYAIINAAERNNIGVAMANLSTTNFELGRLFEKVVKPMAPVKVSVQEVMEKALAGTGADTEMVPEDLGEAMVTLFRPVQDRGPNMLNVNMGDKQLVFQVEPDLFRAIQGLNTEDIGMIMRILSMPARLLRAGATLSPDFAVRNPIRDQLSAMIYSKFGYKPGYDLARGIFEIFKKGDVYDLWKMSGGEHSMMVSLDRQYLQKNFKEVVRTKGGTAFHYLKHPIEVLRIISELGEQATRLGEMRNALQAGASPTEAAFASREVTLDFARIGAKTKAINAIVAFWNANVQGLDKMIRSFKEKPVRTSLKVLLGITLPSILLYMANRNDKRWKEIPQWQKDLFWIVMTDKHIYRIPKPFELGILFGSVPERIMEFLDTHDKELFKELEDSLVNGATPGFIPTALAPIIENITNYSFFLNRPIVSRGQEKLPPEAQHGNFTSEVSKLIGEKIGYSPAKIDNLISGYSGGLGKYATAGIDSILNGTGIVNPPPAPAGTLEDMAVAKAFLVRPPVGTMSESVNRLYDKSGKVAGEMAYLKKLFDSKQLDKASKFVKENPDLVYAKLLSGVVSTFSSINKARDQIRQSRLIDPQTKQQKIYSLDSMQTQIARKILEQIK